MFFRRDSCIGFIVTLTIVHDVSCIEVVDVNARAMSEVTSLMRELMSPSIPLSSVEKNPLLLALLLNRAVWPRREVFSYITLRQ